MTRTPLSRSKVNLQGAGHTVTASRTACLVCFHCCVVCSAKMAVSMPRSFGHKLDELLKCPVCLDTFHEPRTLCCLHTFCTECLEGCRRLLRRDIECPVCKRVSSLPPAGVRGLPTDYRIEQIRDFFNDMQASEDAANKPIPVDSLAEPSAARLCDVCKAQQRTVTSTQHCVQVQVHCVIASFERV